MKSFDLQLFRRDKNLTQKQLAKILSCEQSFVSRVEKNSRQFPESMQVILQSIYGDITEYITEIDPVNISDTTAKNLLFAGADAFTRQMMQMMNDKLIAPYAMIIEKDKEIERLNRLVGKLDAQIESSRKTNGEEEDNSICSDNH